MRRVLAPVAVLIFVAVAGAQLAATLVDRSETQRSRGMVATAAPQALSAPFVVHADSKGHFIFPAMINGRSIQVVFDTGASVVTLPYEEAARLGFTPGAADFRHPVSTANGIVQTAQVFLAEVRVGPHTLQNIRAVIMPAGVLEKALLGMSVLSRLGRIEIENGRRLTVRS